MALKDLLEQYSRYCSKVLTPFRPMSNEPSLITVQYDLLSNNQPGINYPSEHIGAFVAQDWPPGMVNDEDQAYVPWAATQVLC